MYAANASERWKSPRRHEGTAKEVPLEPEHLAKRCCHAFVVADGFEVEISDIIREITETGKAGAVASTLTK